MLMIVGKNFRKFTTPTRNNYIIFSLKLFDGNCKRLKLEFYTKKNFFLAKSSTFTK